MDSNHENNLSTRPNKDRSFDLNELPDSGLEGDWNNNDELLSDEDGGYESNPLVSNAYDVVEGEYEDEITDLTIDRLDEDNEGRSTAYIVHNAQVSHSYNQESNRKFLSNAERWSVYAALLERSVNGKLKRDTTKEVSSLLSVPIRVVQRIWKQAQDNENGVRVDVCHRKTKNCGRKRLQVGLSGISSIPLNRRRTLRSLSQALKISYATLYARFKEGQFRCHSNAIGPHLKEEHKIARLQFCISMLDKSSLPHEPNFVDMYNIVHIDEKWFYVTKRSKTFYLGNQEGDPSRSCQNKNFIDKVMFLTVVARPRFDDEGNEIFSGKIGIFPFVTQQPVLRRSWNRNVGTLETKPITHVKKETIRAFLFEKVIPAIEAKWPREDSRNTIFIQQDNAITHVSPEDEEFQAAASQNGFDIRLMCQPTNSPDLNVLDLGFFRSIQALQDKELELLYLLAKFPDQNRQGLHVVKKSFEEYSTSKINRVFLSLQLCMREIMIAEGSNRYKLPHMSKYSLERNGALPRHITLDYPLIERVMDMLAARV